MSAALGHYWRGECPLYGPAALQSSRNDAIGKSEPVAPFGHAKSLATICEQLVSGFVATVGFRCHPSAIVRGISEAVINAVDAVFIGRRVSHIIKEVLKRAPSLADGYAIFRIRCEGRIAGSIAAPNHAVPDIVNSAIGKSVGFVRTSAGARAVSGKARYGSCHFIPALTNAEIARVGAGKVIGATDHSKHSESATDFVIPKLLSCRFAPATERFAADKRILPSANDIAALAPNNPAQNFRVGSWFDGGKMSKSVARVYLVFHHGVISLVRQHYIMPSIDRRSLT